MWCFSTPLCTVLTIKFFSPVRLTQQIFAQEMVLLFFIFKATCFGLKMAVAETCRLKNKAQ
jgi:hypothetical protein